MTMGLGAYASRVVATKVVATDGTGDFTDIQDAIDDLPADGGVVYIKEGTYNVSSPITLSSAQISLFGAGKSTVIQSSGASTLIALSAGLCNIRDMFLSCDGGSTTADYGITLTGAADWVRITNIFIAGAGIDGISAATGAGDLVISKCSIAGCTGNGISTGASLAILISNNVIYTNGGDGISLVGTGEAIINGNVCLTNTGQGINLNSDADDNIISSNQCAGNSAYGVRIQSADCNKNIVIGNRFVANTSGGLSDGGTSTEAAHNVT